MWEILGVNIVARMSEKIRWVEKTVAKNVMEL
jgi:hypothetical protein